MIRVVPTTIESINLETFFGEITNFTSHESWSICYEIDTVYRINAQHIRNAYHEFDRLCSNAFKFSSVRMENCQNSHIYRKLRVKWRHSCFSKILNSVSKHSTEQTEKWM